MKTLRTVLSFFAGAILVCAAALPSFSQQIITYQGVATQNGNLVSGPHGVTVSIYTSATGGSAIWTEGGSVTFTNGVFNIALGENSANPLPIFNVGGVSGTPAGTNYWLGVAVDGGTELAPRSQLGSAPMAWSSRYADSARAVGGAVTSVNTLSGPITLQGGGGTTVSKNGQTITISSSGGGGTGIQGVQNTDGTLTITNPNGPTATIGVANNGIGTAQLAALSVTTAKIANNAVTTAQIANSAVNTAQIANNAVTSAQIGSGTATNGQVLTANGSGGVAWTTPSSGLSLPISQTQSNASPLFALTNSGAAQAIMGSASAQYIAGVEGTTSNSTGGIGVLGMGSDGMSVTSTGTMGVLGTSNASTGVFGVSNTGIGVEGWGATTGIGIYGITGSTSVTARAAVFQNGSASTADCVDITNAGTGNGLKVANSSTSTTSAGIYVTMASSSAAAIIGENDGSSIGVEGLGSGGGIGLYGRAESSGRGIVGVTTGTGDPIYGEADGTGNAIEGYAFGPGGGGAAAGVYAHAKSGSSNCNALVANMEGTTTSSTAANNPAIFQSAGTNVARIDRTGKGFFDGGTQTGGADVAEQFDVAGNRSNYSPGDVLVISKSGNRTVEKSSEPYSRCVVGVYATKPGVTLTNLSMDADESQRVPMGVIGVIPTNVTNEGGSIEPGDLLVTSSTTGCAMKADLSKLQIGQALGKALEPFKGNGAGTILVLVGKY